MFDVLIIGGGVAGVSSALILGSAKNKVFASDKKSALLHIKKIHHCKKRCSITHMEFRPEN